MALKPKASIVRVVVSPLDTGGRYLLASIVMMMRGAVLFGAAQGRYNPPLARFPLPRLQAFGFHPSSVSSLGSFAGPCADEGKAEATQVAWQAAASLSSFWRVRHRF